MNRILLASAALAGALALSLFPAPAFACGEAMLNSGKGLPYQSYLAPRPAVVLIYATPDPTASASQREALFSGLKKAGHTVTMVGDAAALTSALRERHYDVVISALDAAESVTAAAQETQQGKTALVPVMARSEANSLQVRGKYSAVLVDGASLGQYLKIINTVLAL